MPPSGRSPRVRGDLPCPDRLTLRHGSIPARAGSSGAAPWRTAAGRVHPRLRGGLCFGAGQGRLRWFIPAREGVPSALSGPVDLPVGFLLVRHPAWIAGPRSMKPGCSDATTTGHRRTPIQPAGAFRTHEFLCSVAAEWRSHRVVAVVAEYQYLAARSRAHAIQSRLAHASRQCDVAAADHRPAGIRRDRGAFN